MGARYFRDLPSPARLNPGDSLYSATRAFRLYFQDDGNLVLYAIDDTNLPQDIKQAQYERPIFATGTDGMGATHCELLEDGDLVVYDDNGVALWASDTAGDSGAFLRCQDDGDLVIFQDSVVRWSSNTRAGERDGPTSGGLKVQADPNMP